MKGTMPTWPWPLAARPAPLTPAVGEALTSARRVVGMVIQSRRALQLRGYLRRRCRWTTPSPLSRPPLPAARGRPFYCPTLSYSTTYHCRHRRATGIPSARTMGALPSTAPPPPPPAPRAPPSRFGRAGPSAGDRTAIGTTPARSGGEGCMRATCTWYTRPPAPIPPRLALTRPPLCQGCSPCPALLSRGGILEPSRSMRALHMGMLSHQRALP